jgi:hypothetical protein
MSDPPWRAHARRVITEVLAALPGSATEAQKRKAIRAAYPFGERKMHPYKMWLAEVRAALGRRPNPLVAAAKAKEPAPTIEFVFDGRVETRRYWLAVRCGWHEGNRYVSPTPRCLMCAGHCRALSEVLADPMFLAPRLAAIDGDTVAESALLDWLEERLGVRPGDTRERGGT